MKLPPLSQIYFYLTEGCNLACCHCWLAPKFDPTGRKHGFLSVELFEQAIDEALPLGLSGVKLTGGEPLLHPEFFRLIEIIRKNKLKMVLETNGWLCTAEVAAMVSELPNRFVSVSIDGAEAETHDRIRGVDGSFARAKEAVSLLVQTGTRPQIIMTVMQDNAGQVKEMIRLGETLGAASIKFNVLQPTARGEQLHQRRKSLAVDETIRIGRYVEKDLIPNSSLMLYFDYPMAFRSLGQVCSEGGSSVCGIKGIIGVLFDGHYALCGIGSHVPELVFGRVGKDSLREIWRNHPTLKDIRFNLPKKLQGVCDACLMKHRCLGSCLAQNFYQTGSIWAPFWFCAEAEKTGLFPKKRIHFR